MTKPQDVWVHGGEEVKAPFHYKGCGLDDIWLMNGYDVEKVEGEEVVSVRNLDGLWEAIAAYLVTRKKVLGGKEIRFLRTQLNLTQSELARLLGCDGQQVARYEKGANRMPGPADRVLRMLVREHYDGEVSARDILNALDVLDGRVEERHVFSATPEGCWKAAA